jgi:excinuclease ABC subunit A
VIKVEMHFLPDVYVPCDVCHGKRYNRETLEVLYKGRNIAEVLNLTVEDAHAFFAPCRRSRASCRRCSTWAWATSRLGQSATTLSGGEAQRVKLALELSKRDTGRTLYILDEPTTGLHFHDIELLLKVLHQLRDAGNTIVVIEHNLDVIKTADWLIDMGPEGGAGGGRPPGGPPPSSTTSPPTRPGPTSATCASGTSRASMVPASTCSRWTWAARCSRSPAACRWASGRRSGRPIGWWSSSAFPSTCMRR